MKNKIKDILARTPERVSLGTLHDLVYELLGEDTISTLIDMWDSHYFIVVHGETCVMFKLNNYVIIGGIIYWGAVMYEVSKIA